MSDARDLLLAGGLEDSSGGGGVPLVRAKGRFIGFGAETKTSDDGGEYINTLHHLTELEVLEVREGESFEFDSFELPINASTKKNTKWGIWVQSVADVVGIDLEERDKDGELVYGRYRDIYSEYLDGNVGEIARTADLEYRRKNKSGEWYDAKTKAWQLVGLDGVGSNGVKTPKEALNPVAATLALVNESSNLVEFLQKVSDTPVITQDKKLFAALGKDPSAWLALQVKAGDLHETGDWYSTDAGDVPF